jgi:hypothetical protein
MNMARQAMSLFGAENSKTSAAIASMEKVVGAAGLALQAYRVAVRLAAIETATLTKALALATGPIGIAIAAIGALATGVALAVRHIQAKRKAAEDAARSLAAYEAMANRSAAATAQLAHAQREGQLTALDYARGQDMARRAIEQMEQKEQEAARAAAEKAAAERRAADEAARRAVEEAIAAEVTRRAKEATASYRDSALDLASAMPFVRREIEEINQVFEDQTDLLADPSFQRVVETYRELAVSIQGLALDARDAAARLAEASDEINQFEIAPEQAQQWLDLGTALEGVASEAQRVAQAYGSTALGIEQANQVIQRSTEMALEAAQAKVVTFAARLEDAVGGALKGILMGTAEFSDLWLAIWSKVVDQIIAKILELKAIQSLISGLAGFILGIFGLQRGGVIVATRPQTVWIGETRPERATITPLSGEPRARIVTATEPTPLRVGMSPERVVVEPLARTPDLPRESVQVVEVRADRTTGAILGVRGLFQPVVAEPLAGTGRGIVAGPVAGPALPGISGRLVESIATPVRITGPTQFVVGGTREREGQHFIRLDEWVLPSPWSGTSWGGDLIGGGGGGGRVTAFQRGGSLVATEPTVLVAGERGPERVTVEPLAFPVQRGGPTIIIQGPVFMDDVTWARLERRLTSRRAFWR